MYSCGSKIIPNSLSFTSTHGLSAIVWDNIQQAVDEGKISDEQIDWPSLRQIAKQTNMHKFLDCLNAICIDKLGLPSHCVPHFELDETLKERVWNEILQPEFSEQKPSNVGYLRSWSYMIRRWWANRWKHRIVYNESLVKTFFVQVYSHLLKPHSLKL